MLVGELDFFNQAHLVAGDSSKVTYGLIRFPRIEYVRVRVFKGDFDG